MGRKHRRRNSTTPHQKTPNNNNITPKSTTSTNGIGITPSPFTEELSQTQASPPVVNLNKRFNELIKGNENITTDELLKEVLLSNERIAKQNEDILKKMESVERNTNRRIEEIIDSMTSMKEELVKVIESQQFLDAKYEKQKEQITKLENKIASMSTDICDKEITIKQLSERIKKEEAASKQNESAINALEQYGRRQMINISGVPRQNNEDTDDIVFDLLVNKLGLDLYLDDVEITHRTSSKPTAPIIVKFNSRRIRDEVWNSRYKLKHVKASDLGFNSNNPIYFNESLTERNRIIFKSAWDTLKKPGHFDRVITENGITYAWQKYSKDSKSEKIIIKSKNDIPNLLLDRPPQNKK